MSETTYRNRKAVSLENEHLRIIVSVVGGHIAAIIDKASGINPLWSPPWPSIEPSTYDRAKHPEYGNDSESRLLSGILGHNLCLDVFGGPSDEEAAAGLSVHGEVNVVPHAVLVSGDTLTDRVTLPSCNLTFERRIRLSPGSRRMSIAETVENLAVCDRPIAWTQHVTMGPPFLEKGKTLLRATAGRSKTMEVDFTGGIGHMKPGVEFNWPHVPCVDGTTEDLRTYTNRPVSGAYSTHLMDTGREDAWFAMWSPSSRLALSYAWKRSDFPWLGIWEENYSRKSPPWNGKTLTRAMEFGASPYPESRRKMIDRGSLFGVPGYCWIPAKKSVTVEYTAALEPAASVDMIKPV